MSVLDQKEYLDGLEAKFYARIAAREAAAPGRNRRAAVDAALSSALFWGKGGSEMRKPGGLIERLSDGVRERLRECSSADWQGSPL